MFVEKVELSVDAHCPSDFPPPLDGEVIFVGRSNVGKSSMLNVIFGKKIARTSSTPGKTKSLIFFKVNNKYYFVDFPGYGYSKTSKVEREKFQLLVNTYFEKRKPSGIFMLVDSMIPNQRSDIEAFEFFKHFADTFIILTKVDRLSRSKMNEKVSEVQGTFKEAKSIIFFSSVSRVGLAETEKILREILKTR